MAASLTTVMEVVKILRKYIPADKAGLMLEELQQVKGNSSFTSTIRLIAREWNIQ